MKRFVGRPWLTLFCTSSLLLPVSQAIASGFQLWEQDGSSLGNYHAGYAAEANDASIAWYNPAGIMRIKNQQLLLGGAAILTDFEYKGNVSLTELSPTIVRNPFPRLLIVPTTITFNSVKTQGGLFTFVPNLHYVAPINDHFGFGFSVDVPFGLKTSYGMSTPLRYAATYSSISIVDISPSLGFRINDKASVGFGFDVQKASAEFDSVAGLIDPAISILNPKPKTVLTQFDTTSTNEANDTGYGYHLGALYEFNQVTRMGISYHSQVVHHFTGTSKFVGPLANTFNDGNLESSHAKTNINLPAYTALSLFHRHRPSWAFMGTVIYTQWNTFKTLNLYNVAGLQNAPPPTMIAASENITVSIPQHYRNTWNVSLGANYYPTDTIILRTGLGYDQSPVRNAYRDVRLPGTDRYIVALGGHFQATKTIGFDLAWAHIFIQTTNINPPPIVTGAQTVATNGSVYGGADVFSGQVVWDIV